MGLLDKFNAIDPKTGLSLADRLGAAGAIGLGDSDALANLRALGQQRALMARRSAMNDRISALLMGDDGAGDEKPASPTPVAAPKRMGPVMDEGLPQPDAAPMAAPTAPSLPSKRRFDPDRLQRILTAAAYSGDEGAGKAAEVYSKLRPDLDKGLYLDDQGRVRVREGYTDAAQALSGATTAGSEAAKADFDVINVNLPDGSSLQIPRGLYIQMQSSGQFPQLGRSQTPGGKVAQEEAARAPYDFVDAKDPEGRPVKVAKSIAAGQTFVGQSPAEEAAAKNAVDAADRAPGLIAQADQTLSLINDIANDPSRQARTGKSALLWGVPGTKGADFDRKVEQLKGQVFLQAFNQLKGGGAITEIEGKKADQAIARLDRAQSEEGFVAALKDLSDVIKLGRQRVLDNTKRVAGARTAPAARSAAAGGGYSVVGVRRAGQ